MGIGKSRVEKSYYITVEYTGIEDTNKDVQQLVTVI
jgi:hypothetical protein